MNGAESIVGWIILAGVLALVVFGILGMVAGGGRRAGSRRGGRRQWPSPLGMNDPYAHRFRPTPRWSRGWQGPPRR